ncbi:MAG TPA: hypothetical protein DCM07_29505 [Planctomycetaceae bacterium]|nr:hypothetical protein [Planctomycetaceae bacterium]
MFSDWLRYFKPTVLNNCIKQAFKFKANFWEIHSDHHIPLYYKDLQNYIPQDCIAGDYHWNSLHHGNNLSKMQNFDR